MVKLDDEGRSATTGNGKYNRPMDERTIQVIEKKNYPWPCPTIRYHSPVGKSEYVILEVELEDWEILKSTDGHKEERFDHAKTNF
ncbi:hypothetical protein E2C01_046074 [Portunus trituberculatus]|uniref:Uncharacterized protein n=1 Tax=Portunus trituberculatus TaxID=210409 RepID=A0A5B7FXG4_PORTR|nr:hypothetical protein [Portunus trituberculatus]